MALRLIVLQGPSASGKSTLQARLGLPRIVTWTSRPPRSGEENGREYHFGSRDQLQAMYEAGELLEITGYQGNLYGTALSSIDGVMKGGVPHSVVLDAPGAAKVKELYGSQALLIGIYADKELCRKRLAARGVSEEEQARRLAGYDSEVKELLSCDFIIPNTDDRLARTDALMQWVRDAVRTSSNGQDFESFRGPKPVQ